MNLKKQRLKSIHSSQSVNIHPKRAILWFCLLKKVNLLLNIPSKKICVAFERQIAQKNYAARFPNNLFLDPKCPILSHNVVKLLGFAFSQGSCTVPQAWTYTLQHWEFYPEGYSYTIKFCIILAPSRRDGSSGHAPVFAVIGGFQDGVNVAYWQTIWHQLITVVYPRIGKNK
jgi:hypothetical protein